MGFWENVLSTLKATMTTPTNYGWFHLMFMALLIVGCVFAVKYARHSSAKTMRIVLIVASSIMILFEIYKQIVFTFNVVDGQIVSHYQWYAFPFQLCSTPMYVMLIAGLCKPSKFQRSLTAYLALFSLFGGLCVYLYPNDVFTTIIGINIQTMIHHGLQIAIACFLLSYYRNELNFKFYLKSLPVFAVTVAIAMGLNLIAPMITTDTFNMFYISPYYACTLPILNMLYPLMPYPLFLCMYVIGFCLVSYIIYIIAFGFNKLVFKFEKTLK